MESILIVNAVVVNEGREAEGDVYVRNGRIARVGGDLGRLRADVVLDAAGAHLLPGMIDAHVHFREPGLTHKGDLASESRAAVAGGVTSFMDMPNTLPPTTTLEALEDKYRRAAASSLANYAFYFGATNNNLDTVARLAPGAACGVKVFMGASTGDMLVDAPHSLERVFAEAPLLVAAHCEDTPRILANEARLRERWGAAVPPEAHPEIRDAEACYASSSLAVALAKRHGTRLHLLHLSTARELELLTPGPPDGKVITAEACVHHLYFSAEDYADLGNRLKCNPAVKSRADREALLTAVADGRIDTIGTDHAPHSLEEKQRPYLQAPSGIPLIQHALPCLLEHVHDGRLPLTLVVEKTSHAVARRFGIVGRGFIREGYWADLVLVSLLGTHTVRREGIHSRCGWSPFEGRAFRSAVWATLVSGRIAFQAGTHARRPGGLRLEFAR
jgi:dihydroorotase